MVSTPDGGTLFVAEAGVLAVIDANSGASYVQPTKILPISTHGVRAVELLLDPLADLDEDPDGPESLIYVAGGRLGLWVMRADPRASEPMPAARIDDADSSGAQMSPRWCTDVDVMLLGGNRYLLALFADHSCSRLRVYPLVDARAVLNANPGEETGNELAAAKEVKLGGNCRFETPRLESFGFGLAVDGDTVYVAMGPYGLVRVRFTNPNDVTIVQKTDGPYFGDGSYYDLHVNGVYDNFEYRGGTPIEVVRSDPPFFMDVAIELKDPTHYLWAAVEHLGLVRFNVTNPNGWSTTTAIDHQEGVLIPGSGVQDDVIRIVRVGGPGGEADINIRNYAHRLRVAQTDTGNALAVAVNRRPLILSDSLLDEGRVLGYLGDTYAGIPQVDPLTQTGGEHEYTLLYDLDELEAMPPATAPPATAQHVWFVRDGGRHVHLAEEPLPDSTNNPPLDQMIVFGGRHDADRGQYMTFRERISWEAPVYSLLEHLERKAEHRPGRWVYDISHSLANPELLYTGANDAGLYHDGILATCGAAIRRFYMGGNDLRSAMGIVFNATAVWPGPPEPGTGAATEFVLGAGKGAGFPGDQEDRSAWMFTHFRPGEDLCNSTPTVAPDHLKRLYVLSPEDLFESIGRMHYLGGVVSPGYDAHVLATEGPLNELAFVNRSATPAGIVVLLRSPIESELMTSSDGDHVHPGNTDPVSFKRELITHPEFDQVYFQDPSTEDYIFDNDLDGWVVTFLPRLTQIPAPTGAPESQHWALAVPSGAVYCPDSLPDQPSPEYVAAFEHSMVRVFDVHDYDDVTTFGASIPNYSLIGPREKSAAFRIEPLTFQGKSYLFVANTTKTLDVWDVTDLLDMTSGTVIDASSNLHVEEWVAPLSVSDDLPNNLSGLQIDRALWQEPGGDRDEVYVYVSVSRVGIEVLRFLPSNSKGQRLESVGRIELPSGMAGLKIRQEADPDERTLLVGDSQAGIRTFVYGD